MSPPGDCGIIFHRVALSALMPFTFYHFRCLLAFRQTTTPFFSPFGPLAFEPSSGHGQKSHGRRRKFSFVFFFFSLSVRLIVDAFPRRVYRTSYTRTVPRASCTLTDVYFPLPNFAISARAVRLRAHTHTHVFFFFFCIVAAVPRARPSLLI